MSTAMTLTYEAGENLYINVTNRCPCQCIFCIRNNGDGAYGSDSLWLEHEPSMSEMQADLAKRNLSEYKNIVFCGYGEPLMRLQFVCELAAYLREIAPETPLRLNTNGLADLYNPEEAKHTAAEQTAPLFDRISISLNGGNAEVYNRVTRPRGNDPTAYETMLHYASTCKALGTDVVFTVVDVITEEEIAEARKTADSLGIPLDVREYIH